MQEKFKEPLVLDPYSFVLRKILAYQAPSELYNNCYYFGQWQSGMRNGYGKLFFPDGSYYSGNFRNDRAEGQGRLHHTNGDYYKG